MARSFFLVCAAFWTACAPVATLQGGFDWPKSPDDRVTLTGGFIQAAGVGKGDPAIALETQRKSGMRDAAILDARARLENYIGRIMLPGQTSVGERAGAEPEWRKKLDAALIGLEVADTTFDGETAVVVVRAEKNSVLRSLGLLDEAE